MASLSELGAVAKGWKGEPGDKRNTKYALSAAGGAVVLPGVGTVVGPVGYGFYRNSTGGKKRREESMESAREKRAEKARGKRKSEALEKGWKGEPGDKRNTKYAASAWGGSQVGGVLGAAGGPPGILLGTLAGGAAGAGAYGAYRTSPASRRARARSTAYRAEERMEQARRNRKIKEIKNGVEKAWRGEEGDKRNTKYALAGYGGMAGGAAIGRQIGARSQGMSVREVKRGGKAAFTQASEASLARNGFNPSSTTSLRTGMAATRQALAEGQAARNGAKGMARTVRGNKIGALAGLVAGAGGYAAYRQSDRSKAARSTSVKRQGVLRQVG